MDSSEKLFASRILTVALAVSFLIIAHVTYTEYSSEISEKVTVILKDSLQDLDTSVAKN